MAPSSPSRAGDDTTELAPQGDDEIGRTSLNNAEGEMRHPRALDHPRELQVDRPRAEVVEGPSTKHQRPGRLTRLAEELGGLRLVPEDHVSSSQPVFGVATAYQATSGWARAFQP
jgi:hypothetical protein